jgi:hypothetical protein
MPDTPTSAALAAPTPHATPTDPGVQIPTPPSERRAWALAGALVVLGAGVLAAVLSGVVGQSGHAPGAQPPAVVTVATTPVPAPASSAAAVATARRALARAPLAAGPVTARQSRELASYVTQTDTQTHIDASWMAGFYPIYAEAQRTFAVNWLLLASIHRQESAFSTAAGIYHGLNFAGCCGGPMQFNVTNGGAGTPSTWALVSDSYRYGRRPAAYDHETARHPSIYDDFDAIMAAARLLSADGATMALNEGAWDAAYDYYGHDEAGVTYADEVLARAIGWSQHGWCINCGIDPALLSAVHAAYGAPVQEALEASEVAAAARAKQHAHAKRR